MKSKDDDASFDENHSDKDYPLDEERLFDENEYS